MILVFLFFLYIRFLSFFNYVTNIGDDFIEIFKSLENMYCLLTNKNFNLNNYKWKCLWEISLCNVYSY